VPAVASMREPQRMASRASRHQVPNHPARGRRANLCDMLTRRCVETDQYPMPNAAGYIHVCNMHALHADLGMISFLDRTSDGSYQCAS